jgi:hypothetical protein
MLGTTKSIACILLQSSIELLNMRVHFRRVGLDGWIAKDLEFMPDTLRCQYGFPHGVTETPTDKEKAAERKERGANRLLPPSCACRYSTV